MQHRKCDPIEIAFYLQTHTTTQVVVRFEHNTSQVVRERRMEIDNREMCDDQDLCVSSVDESKSAESILSGFVLLVI